MSLTRILVVDDHRVFVDALSARLAADPDLFVVGAAVSTAEALAAVMDNPVDVALIDVAFCQGTGLALASRLREAWPDVHIVVVTGVEDVRVAAEALRFGARAWVPKQMSAEHLIEVVKGVMREESWVPPRLLTDVLCYLTWNSDGGHSESIVSRLTGRELDVLRCLVDGLDRQATARRLYVSVNTVRTHVQHVLAKLEVHSSLEAVAVALHAGFGNDPVNGVRLQEVGSSRDPYPAGPDGVHRLVRSDEA